MENPDARNPNPQKKNLIHIEYCTNCQSHNWNTHHNQAKYHETYIKLKNLIESSFRQNPPIVTANKVPNHLMPIKQQENKYYNQLTKKYMFFPNIGSFEITLNDQLIYSKKKTNNWPCFQTVLNEISIKIYNQPFEMKPKAQKKTETNQTETQFSSDQKIFTQGFKTLYKRQSKSNPKNFGKFTLTDHFKSFHAQNPKKAQQQGFYFDSSTTIKQSPDNTNKNNINVEDIDGLRKALKNKTDDNESAHEDHNQKKGNQKQILINLCSIEEQGANIKQIAEFRASTNFKKTSAIVNSYPIEISVYNGSEKSLSIQRFQELNNDLKKIEKQFQHIEKKMIINDGEKQPKQLNESCEESRVNNPTNDFADKENTRQQSQSGFIRSKLDSKQNFLNYHLQRYSKQNKLLSYLANMQTSQIKATDRYDDRYISPTYFEQNQIYKNVPSKKYSEIQKYLKANNEQKNKKLKKIYGDWKVGSNNLNYLYYVDGGKKLLRDSTNTNSQTKHKYRQRNGQQSDSSSDQVTSESSNSQCNKFQSPYNNSGNKKTTAEEPQIKKHSSFIIKNKSLHKTASNTNSRQKLSKYSLNEKPREVQPRYAPNKSGFKNHKQSTQNIQVKQIYTKQNSKSFQVSATKNRASGNPFAKREKYSLVENTPKLVEQIQRRQVSRQSNRSNEVQQEYAMQSGSTISKSNSYLSVTNDPSQRKLSHSSKDQKTQQKMTSMKTLPKIQEIKEVDFTEQSSNGRPSNRVTIEFHEFQLKVKSSRRSNMNDLKTEKQPEKGNIQEEKQSQTKDKQHGVSNDANIEQQPISHEQNLNNQGLLNEEQNQMNNERYPKQPQRKMSITQQVYVQLDLQEMNQSQIMKTIKVDDQQSSNSNPNNSVPLLNLNQNSQDCIKSNQNLQVSGHNLKSKSNSSKSGEPSEAIASKSNHHSRNSSLYQQPTFCHAISHNLNETNHCKCEQRIQQLQTNRMKIESQRKEKQMMKEKKFEENQKRKELIEKQKQQYLKQLQIGLKEKKNSHSNSKRSASSHMRSLSKQNSPKESQNTVSKDKRAISNNVQGRKSPFKNVTNQKPDAIKEDKRESKPNLSQNKPTKSVTQTKQQKHKPQSMTQKPISMIETNSKGKSQSKNALQSKTIQMSHQIPKVSLLQKAKDQKKENKSISSKIHQKPKTLTRKANNHRNKSYFMTEKEKSKQISSAKVSQKQQNFEQEQENQALVEAQIEKQDVRSKCASIAIQTMQAQEWKKYSQHNTKQRTQRNKSIQSRRSQVSVKSARQSVKSVKNKEIIKETYSPIEIQIKGGKTKTKKGKLRQKYQAKSRITQGSKHSRKGSSNSHSESEKTIVNMFETEENPQQMVSQLDLDNRDKNSVSYKGERQKALILKQLYDMDEQLQEELKHYESLYQSNSLYHISQRDLLTKSNNPIFQSLAESQEISLTQGEQISFTQVQNTVQEKSKKPKLSLFGTDSISIHQLKSNRPYLTKNFHKALHVLAQKNQLLIVRLFEDYKSQTNFHYADGKRNVLINKSTYAVWLCINKTWKLISVDNVVPVKLKQTEGSSKHTVQPLYSYHQGNQRWPQILEKCLAEAVGGYTKLFSLSIGQIFSILTGSNHLAYSINDNLSKNKLFLKEITQNDKKNFIMVCQKHPMNLKEQNDKNIESSKIFYLLSKKIVHNGQCDQILFKMRETILDESIPNPEPYYIRYDKFCEKFKTCQVLHLRQHHYFCSLKLNQTFFSNKSKKAVESYFNVIELSFDEQSFGTITVCNQAKSDIKTYLYKLENSDNQIMKLVGQASKQNKKQLFFDCYFQDQRYYLFIQSSNPNSVVSFIGEGRPEIKIKEQILSNGLRNQLIEYLPVSNYEGLDARGSVMGRSTNSNFYSTQNDSSNKKLRNMEDLREMFIELLVQERKKK